MLIIWAFQRLFMQMMLQKFDAAGHEWALRHFDHTLGATVVKS